MITCADLNLDWGLIQLAARDSNWPIFRAWVERHGGQCLFCEKEMHYGKRWRRQKVQATVDHIDALSLGGTNRPGNLQVICSDCNQTKSRLESEMAQFGCLRRSLAA